MTAYTVPFAKLGRHDVDTVGGKNSSLGEMISHLAKLGVTVPDGFATTAQAYRDFLAHEGLAQRISKELAALDVDDVEKLTAVGAKIRHWILSTPFPEKLDRAAPVGIGKRGQHAIQRRGRHSYIFVVSPLARSHSSGVTFFTVWPNVQM